LCKADVGIHVRRDEAGDLMFAEGCDAVDGNAVSAMLSLIDLSSS
jgi:hypothetical protein